MQGFLKKQLCFYFSKNWRGTCPPPCTLSSAGPATTYWTFLTLFLRSRNGVLISFARSAWQSCTPCYRILRHFLVKYQQLFCVTDNIPTLKAKEKSCNSSYLHTIHNAIFSYLLRDTWYNIEYTLYNNYTYIMT